MALPVIVAQFKSSGIRRANNLHPQLAKLLPYGQKLSPLMLSKVSDNVRVDACAFAPAHDYNIVCRRVAIIDTAKELVNRCLNNFGLHLFGDVGGINYKGHEIVRFVFDALQFLGQ